MTHFVVIHPVEAREPDDVGLGLTHDTTEDGGASLDLETLEQDSEAEAPVWVALPAAVINAARVLMIAPLIHPGAPGDPPRSVLFMAGDRDVRFTLNGTPGEIMTKLDAQMITTEVAVGTAMAQNGVLPGVHGG